MVEDVSNKYSEKNLKLTSYLLLSDEKFNPMESRIFSSKFKQLKVFRLSFDTRFLL